VYLVSGLALASQAGCPQPTDGGDPNVPSEPASAELGFTDFESGAYARVSDGGVMPLFTGGQGGSHIFATLRARGFPAGENGIVRIALAEIVTRADTSEVLHDFTQTIDFAPRDDGAVEVTSRFVFLDALPDDLDGVTTAVRFVLTSAEDSAITTTIEQMIVLDLGEP
jgi:hypothetical protein